MCKIPEKNGHSDTLKLFYSELGNWPQLSVPVYSVNDWQFYSFSLSALPPNFNFAFEATSGAGGGVFLDDIKLYDDLVSIQVQNACVPEPLIYQNRASSKLTAEFITKELTQTEIKLISVEGRIIQSAYFSFLYPGNHSVTLDISDVKTGIYILSMVQNDHLFTRKIFVY